MCSRVVTDPVPSTLGKERMKMSAPKLAFGEKSFNGNYASPYQSSQSATVYANCGKTIRRRRLTGMLQNNFLEVISLVQRRKTRLIVNTIERGFVPGWDKNFADPTVPWTLPISKTDNFVDQHEEWITIQLTMETVFFEMEQRNHVRIPDWQPVGTQLEECFTMRKRYCQGLFPR